MKNSGRFGSKAGVTLVELLVVMLIVVILAVSLTPLFRDYITRAQYTAEAVPVVGDMRTKVTMFQYEHGFLPGIPRDAGKPVETAGGTFDPDWDGPGQSLLRPGVIPAETFSVVPDTSPIQYEAAVVDSHDENDAGFTVDEVNAVDGGDHFSVDLQVDYEHYTGNRLRPNHVFYRTDYAGYKQGGHICAIGVFGDGDGLAVGTGYAVMEIHNPDTETKIVATWERWRAVDSDAGQITFKNSDEYAMPGNPAELQKKNVCWIGAVDDLMSEDDDDVKAALDNLSAAGWSF
jgi:prepilin-type N-terminal cleavage/methylation domain-containing protein